MSPDIVCFKHNSYNEMASEIQLQKKYFRRHFERNYSGNNAYTSSKQPLPDTQSLFNTCLFIFKGMAYGLLGNLQPIVGIYMAFFPVLIYCIFGTSRHASIGQF